SWSSENRMTPASFNIEDAPTPPDGYFVGDYEGLVAMGKNFGAFFSMPTAADSGSIFFRDPAPTDPPANVNTDTEAGTHNEPTIAVDPTNPLHMIASANDYQGTGLNGGGQLQYTAYPRARVTFDGGQTWTTFAIPFNGYNFVVDPSVSFDADGTAYFAAL